MVLNNPYFEANAGGSDLTINNTGNRPVTVVINGGNFHRVSNTAYTTYNILASSTGGGKLTVILNGTTFQSAGSYVPDASRPYWRELGNVEFIDIGCTFMEATSKAISISSGSIPRSGRINADGSVGIAPGVSSVNVVATGVYDVTFSNPLAVAADCYVVQITPISAPNSVSCDVTYIGVYTFRVTLRNTLSGAGISSSFAFSITRLL
ncbi:phage tail protein [Shigella flexneri]|nr:phage tail protein [Shigella flexneri]